MNKLQPITPMYEQIIRKTEQQIPPDVLLQPKILSRNSFIANFSTFTRTSKFFRARSSVRQHGDRKSNCQWCNGVHTVLQSFSHHWPVVSRFIWIKKSPLASYRKNPFWFGICRWISVIWAVFQEQFRRLKMTVTN